MIYRKQASLLILIIASLAACGGPSPKADSPRPTAAAGDPAKPSETPKSAPDQTDVCAAAVARYCKEDHCYPALRKQLAETIETMIRGLKGNRALACSKSMHHVLVKVMKRAKASEAITNIDLIIKGAFTYFMIPRTTPDGETMLPCTFPKNVACTPAAATPCKGGDGRRFDPNPALWKDPAWERLYFELKGAHYFQYCFESSGVGANARFTVTAHGDLDCDGVMSTYRRSGTGGVGTSDDKEECFIKDSGKYEEVQPLE